MPRKYQTAEDEYVHSPQWISVKKLAVKWGRTEHSLERESVRHAWTSKRAEYVKKLAEKWEERAIERELTRLEQVDQQADPLYETALTLIGAKLGTIAKLVTENPDAASALDPRELDTLMAASLKAHNQRRLIYGGVTSREEQEHRGKIRQEHTVDLSVMSDEELATLERILHRAEP